MQNQPTPNGTPVAELKVHMLPHPAGAQFRFATGTGDYVGGLSFDAANPQAVKAMADWFQAWAAQQAGGIQVASHIAGIRS